MSADVPVHQAAVRGQASMPQVSESGGAIPVPYVLLLWLTFALAVPLFLLYGPGSEGAGFARSEPADLDKPELDAAEVARAREIVAGLEHASEERFVEERRVRVSSRTPTPEELLLEGDFDRERARGEDYAGAGETWLEDVAELPRRASSALKLAGVSREVRRRIVAELESLVPAKQRAGRARKELGDSYVKYIDFIERHHESMRYNEAGELELDHAKCAQGFNRLSRAVTEAGDEVKSRYPPLDDDDEDRPPDA